MTRSPSVMRIALFLLAIAVGFASKASPAEIPVTLRVGVLAFEGQYEDWRAVLTDFERRSDPPLRFQLAIGTYAELLHWMEQEWIDVAVLSPAMFVLSQDKREYPAAAKTFRYLSTIGYPPPHSKLADRPESPAPYRHDYRSVCVVSMDSELRTVEDLIAHHQEKRVTFLFGHPLSTSGRIAPERALRRIGIAPEPDQIEYAQSHTNALQLLIDPEREGERVAFVYDGVLEPNPEFATRIRVLEFPELHEMKLPWDVVVARGGASHLENLSLLLRTYRDAAGHKRFKYFEDWQARYESIQRWAEEIDLRWDRRQGLEMSLSEIGSYLEHSRRTQPSPPRLALVLSGGGAKCSYQVGAMAALEEELRRLNEDTPGEPFGIDLVVGTSGGAINALPAAIGITATSEGIEDFKAVWTGLDQREIIRFSPLLRVAIGLWLGVFQVAVLIILLKILARRREVRAYWLGGILIVLGILEGFIRLKSRISWDWLGTDHMRHHFWLWMSQGHDASVVFLCTVGIVILAAHALMHRRGGALHVSPLTLTVLFLFALITLPLASGYHMLLGEETLSRGRGMEKAMADGMSYMVGRHVERLTGERLQVPPGSPSDRLQALSREIHDWSLLQRDLIVTASCLEQSHSTLPDDLYFYQWADTSLDLAPLGPRWIPLAAYPERLIEVVMGSGSIFPVFPARTLADFPEPGQTVQIVDGGFAHNSPVEAAVLWGATHIVLIEASPQRPARGTGFAANVVAAVEHYARQVEQVDRRSSKEVVVFTLSPQEPHPCLLDFADNLIRATIEKGYWDARGVRADDPRAVPSRRFVKQPGKPVFSPVSP